MKKLLLLFFTLSLALTSCKEKDNKQEYLGAQLLNIHIKNQTTRADEVTNPTSQQIPTIQEVIKRADVLRYMDAGSWKDYRNVALDDDDKDYENNIIKILGDFILVAERNDYDGTPTGKILLLDKEPYEMINCHNYRIYDKNDVLIAYIPDEVLIENKAKIQALYKENNLKAIYKLFQDTFIAIPTTQEIYDKLPQSQKPKS